MYPVCLASGTEKRTVRLFEAGVLGTLLYVGCCRCLCCGCDGPWGIVVLVLGVLVIGLDVGLAVVLVVGLVAVLVVGLMVVLCPGFA